MTLELLESGYWHARFSMNQFIQWPKWRDPERSDCFGWVSDEQIKAAKQAAYTGDTSND